MTFKNLKQNKNSKMNKNYQLKINRNKKINKSKKRKRIILKKTNNFKFIKGEKYET